MKKKSGHCVQFAHGLPRHRPSMLDGAPPRPLPGAAVGSEEEGPDDEEEALLLRDLRVAQAPPGSSHAGRESELAGQPSELPLVDGLVRARRSLAWDSASRTSACQDLDDDQSEEGEVRCRVRQKRKGRTRGVSEGLSLWDSGGVFHYNTPPNPTRRRPRMDGSAHGSITGLLRDRWKEVAIWCVLALLAGVWTLRAHGRNKHELVRRIRPGQRIRWAAKYLASSCDSGGKFRYLARANGLQHPENARYDIVHHAWVVNALAEYALYEKGGGDVHVHPKLNDVPIDVDLALVRSTKYLVDRIRTAADSGDIASGAPATRQSSAQHSLASAPTLWRQRMDGGVEASLVSTGMTLAALVMAERAVGGNLVDRRILRGLGSLIVELQQRNGLFHARVVLPPHLELDKAPPRPQLEGESEHAGVAIYALLLLADLDREEIDGLTLPASSFLKPAVRGLMGTASEQQRMREHDIRFQTPIQHWIAVAAGELLRHDAPYLNTTALPDWYMFSDSFGHEQWTASRIRETLTDHTATMLTALLNEYELLPRQHHDHESAQHGALTKNGEAFHTAQRLRAMHAALAMLPRRGQEQMWWGNGEREHYRDLLMLRDRLEHAALQAAEYLSSLQITFAQNPTHGGFSRSMLRMPNHISEAADDFNDRINEVRMDTVADVLVALIANRRLLLALQAEREARHLRHASRA